MVRQILHGGARIAGHRLTGSLDETGVTILSAGDGLRSYLRWRFRYAGQNRFDERVHQRIERLLATANAEDIECNPIKASSHPLISSGHFGSPIQLVPDRRTNE